MAIGKTFWAMLALVLISSGAIAQRSPLVITGAITGVKVDGPLVRIPFDDMKDPKYPYERKEPPYFTVSVKLVYCNQGDVALIVPISSSFPNERKKILFLELPSSDSKVSDAVSGFVLNPRARDPMEGFVDELQKAEPSGYKFAIIEPEKCYESGDRILVSSGYKLEVRPDIDKRKAPLELAIPEHSYFKIQYSMPMKDSLPVSDAKQRWRRFGRLLTSVDGDFFLETEFIINRRPE